jgi:hypothetical protein
VFSPSGDLNPGALSINGQRESANGFMVNGADAEETGSMAAAIIPNLESIAEFRIPYGPAFRAIETRREFAGGDVPYLANLCHDSRACLYACMYAPPHEFAINIPKILTNARVESYRHRRHTILVGSEQQSAGTHWSKDHRRSYHGRSQSQVPQRRRARLLLSKRPAFIRSSNLSLVDSVGVSLGHRVHFFGRHLSGYFPLATRPFI